MKISEETKRGLFSVLISALSQLFGVVIDALTQKQSDSKTKNNG